MNRKYIFYLIGLASLVLLVVILAFSLAQSNQKQIVVVQKHLSSPIALADCNLEVQKKAIKDSQLDPVNLGISTCYRLDVALDHAKNQLAGSAEITYANLTENSIPDLVFRLFPNSKLLYGGSISVSDILVDGASVSSELFLEKTALRVQLNTPLQPEQAARVKMNFTVRPPVDFGSDRVYGIFNYSTLDQLYFLANFFPIMATRNSNNWVIHPVDGIGDAVTSDTALYQVVVRTPPDWEVVSTGRAIDGDNSDSTTRHFASGPVRDFMLVLAPEMIKHTQVIEGIQVNQWLPPSVDGGWQRALEIASQSLRTFISIYGDYPYTEFDIIAAPLQLAVGVEYPGLILIADKDYKPTQEAQNELAVVIAHEVAHQWWYSTVGNDVTLNPWQDEGLTTYSTLVVLNKYYPAIASYLVDSYQQRISNLEQSSGKERIAQPTSSFTTRPSAYSVIAYAKGALFFRSLEAKLGLPVLSNALSKYYQRFAFQIAQPEDLLAIIENTCACDLKATYSDWGVR